MSWPWWLVKPRLAVVLSGGATLGAFEVGVIKTRLVCLPVASPVSRSA
jgi:hypothetical protein